MLLFLRTGTYGEAHFESDVLQPQGTLCVSTSTVLHTHTHLCGPPGVLVLSILEAVFIESPNRLNLGSLLPTRPLTQGPLWMPIRMITGLPSVGIITCISSRQDRIMVPTVCVGHGKVRTQQPSKDGEATVDRSRGWLPHQDMPAVSSTLRSCGAEPHHPAAAQVTHAGSHSPALPHPTSAWRKQTLWRH